MITRTISLVGIAAALTLAACGSSSTSSSAGYGNSTTTAAKAATTTTPAGTTPAAGASVKVLAGTALGDVLTDGKGMVLYVFDKDQGTTSACTAGCLSAWPPFQATATPTAGGGVDTAKLGTSNGQVTYAGHLLYYFSGDSAAGDMKGADIPNWHPIAPAGTAAAKK